MAKRAKIVDQPIDIPKIVADDMRTRDAMPAEHGDIMVPRAQYRAMLMYIQQQDRLWDGLVLSRTEYKEKYESIKDLLRIVIQKHDIV